MINFILKKIQWFEAKYFNSLFMKIIHKIFSRAFFKYAVYKTSDVCVISYPRAGRTWLRIILTEYLLCLEGLGNKHTVTSLFEFHYRNREFPLISFTHDTVLMHAREKHIERKFYKNKKIILLIRGIKDLIVSYYYQEAARNRGFNGSISEFIRDQRFGVNKVIKFYNGWYNDRKIAHDFYIISYEELTKEPELALEKLLKFIGLPVNKSAIKLAVEESSFDKLYKKQFNSDLSYLKAYDKDPRSLKVRKGKVDNYKEVLNEKDISYIDEQCKGINNNLRGLLQ